MELKELYSLCADRELKTSEVQTGNDFYGHAEILKAYCGLPSSYVIKASLEHAPTLGDFVWGPDLEAKFPTMLTFTRARFKTMRARSQKSLFAVGSPIQYAQGMLSASDVEKERLRLGKSLLIFPTHSSHNLAVQYNVQEYCSRVLETARVHGFNSVRVCMYWKDVLKGGAEIYQKAGCEVVSAGHMFDPLFLRRLKTIIECATIAAGPEGGTSVGYCVALGKPFFFIPTQFGHQMQEISNLAAMEDELNRSKPFYQRVEEVFGTVPSENTTAQQHSLVNEFWGLSSKRSPDELRLIFEICEDLFTRSQRTGVANRNYCFEALTDYVQSKSTAKALLVMDELEASDPESTKEMSIIRGFCLLQSGKRNEARAVIENFLRLHPGHEGALQVLNLCGA